MEGAITILNKDPFVVSQIAWITQVPCGLVIPTELAPPIVLSPL